MYLLNNLTIIIYLSIKTPPTKQRITFGQEYNEYNKVYCEVDKFNSFFM